MTLPFARPENVTNLANLVTYSNDATGGWMGYGLLFVITLVTYLALSDHPPKEALPPTLFVGFVTSLFMVVLHLIDGFVPMVMMLGFAASIALIFGRD